MTHSERVLRLLSDGQPHSYREGYRLGVMLHSRVSDLRKRGHNIRCWREDGSYWYQLLEHVRGEQEASPQVGGASSGHPAFHGPALHAVSAPLKPGPGSSSYPQDEQPPAQVPAGGPGLPDLPRLLDSPARQLTVFEAV